MDKDLKVSIVTPSFNQAKYLRRTIESVLKQDYTNLEYIIIDGGSTDGSIEIIKEYADKLAFWVSEPDKGQSDAINKGWRVASGQIFSWLNSDDMLSKNIIEDIVIHFNDDEKIGIVHGDAELIDKNDNIIGVFRGKRTNYHEMLIYQQKHVPQPSSFYRSEIVKKVKYIDDSLELSMDFDLLLKISKSSKMYYLPMVISKFRIHSETKSHNYIEAHWQESLKIIKQYRGSLHPYTIFRYYLYKLFNALPNKLTKQVRKIRNNSFDQIYLQE